PQPQVAVERGGRGDRPLPVDEERRVQLVGEAGGGDRPLRRQALELAARHDALLRPDEVVDEEMALAQGGLDAPELDPALGDAQRRRCAQVHRYLAAAFEREHLAGPGAAAVAAAQTGLQLGTAVRAQAYAPFVARQRPRDIQLRCRGA